MLNLLSTEHYLQRVPQQCWTPKQADNWLFLGVSLCKDEEWAAISLVPCSSLFLLSASLPFGDCMLNFDLQCLFPRGKKLQQGCNGSFLAKLLLEAPTFWGPAGRSQPVTAIWLPQGSICFLVKCRRRCKAEPPHIFVVFVCHGKQMQKGRNVYSEQIFIACGSGIHRQLVAEELSHHTAPHGSICFSPFPTV